MAKQKKIRRHLYYNSENELHIHELCKTLHNGLIKLSIGEEKYSATQKYNAIRIIEAAIKNVFLSDSYHFINQRPWIQHLMETDQMISPQEREIFDRIPMPTLGYKLGQLATSTIDTFTSEALNESLSK